MARTLSPFSAQRILVMRYRFIGDTLLTIPFLRALRAACPEAVIDVLVGPNSGELLEACPEIDNLIVYDTTRKHRYENASADTPRSFWAYVKSLRAHRYDAAFVLKRSFSSALLAALAGIPRRIGFETEGRGFLLSDRVPYRPNAPEIDCFLDTLRAVGIAVPAEAAGFAAPAPWPEASEQAAQALMAPYTDNRNILIHFTASNPRKEWSSRACAELVRWLIAARSDITLHAFGAPSDAGVYERIVATLPNALQERVKIWCGQLDLNGSMAVISRMNLAVGVDSGTLHMAAAARPGMPIVALFSWMNPDKWRPPGPHTQVVRIPDPASHPDDAAIQTSLEEVKAICQPLLRTI